MNSMDISTTIFSHHLWANIVIFERCCELTEEQLDASIKGVYGSIRETLNHIMRAEKSYFSRISTGKQYNHPKDAPQLSIKDMVREVKSTGAGFIEWASKVDEKDSVMIDWDGTMREVPKTIILNQVINHGTEHRSQILSILTQIGIEPPDVSSWTYFDELEN
jgi:uncharacterized damage-inducible protein DinB